MENEKNEVSQETVNLVEKEQNLQNNEQNIQKKDAITEKYKSLFDTILDNNEKIIKVIKPNKTKKVLYDFMCSIGCFIWLVLFTIPLIADSISTNSNSWIYIFIPIGIFLICVVLTIIFSNISYKNTYYAYTNCRILIRSGIIGVDYKSLDMRFISAVNVNVGFWDKLIKRETGSIIFGSNSSPVVSISGSNGYAYAFRNVEKPYEIYKEMKEVINSFNEKSKIDIAQK